MSRLWNWIASRNVHLARLLVGVGVVVVGVLGVCLWAWMVTTHLVVTVIVFVLLVAYGVGLAILEAWEMRE
jgi:hypothetical protein